MFDMCEEKEVKWCEIKSAPWAHDEPQSVLCKSSTFSSWVESCFVCMKNMVFPIDLRAEREQCRESTIPVVRGIRSPAFGRHVEQVKSQWISGYRSDYLLRLD
jgi:hypothetical protein